MVNLHQPHVLVLPEDRANSQLANGFVLKVRNGRQIQVLKAAGGWREVLMRFNADHVIEMKRRPDRRMVLLIDFDNDPGRLQYAKAQIPPDIGDRVFILGAKGEPEDLKREGLGSYEQIGEKLAEDCREETDTTWGHALLRHNAHELERLREHVRPILF